MGVTFIEISVPSSYTPVLGLIVPPSIGLDETFKVYIVGSTSHPIKNIVDKIKNILFIIFNFFLVPAEK